MHKFKSLDAVRGVAALVVVFGHFANSFFPAITGPGTIHSRFDYWFAGSPLYLLFAANFAVCLFFVLSGFVLSAAFFRTKSLDRIRSSAARRYFRLMLPALASVMLAYGLLSIGGFKNDVAAQLAGSTPWLGSFWNFPANFGHALGQGLAGLFFDSDVSYNTSLWTMSIELFGSFLVFMFLALFGKLRHRWIFYVAFGAIFLHTFYLAFILGMGLCDLWHAKPQVSQIRGRVAGPALAFGLLLGSWLVIPAHNTIFQHFHLSGYTPDQLETLAHITGAALVILAVLNLPLLTRILVTRPLQFLGRISFSLYLIHLLILGSFSSYLFSHPVHNFSYNTSFVIMFGVSLLIILILASYFERFVDRPAIKFSHWAGDVLINGLRLPNWRPLRLRRQLPPVTEPPVAETQA